LTSKLDPGDFTIETVGARFARVGDIWASTMAERNTAAALKALTTR
jgi:DNA primase